MLSFKIRPWQPEDAESLVRYANDADIARNMTDGFPHPFTPEHALRFIENARKDDPLHIFAIEVNGEAAGGIGIHPQSDIYRKNAELGYWLAKPFWGNGITTAAVKEVCTLAFSLYDIQRIYARPFGYNTASMKVLEKAGFTLEARLKDTLYKNGVYTDELIYALRRP